MDELDNSFSHNDNCSYFSSHEFNLIPQNPNDFYIVHQNIRSFNKNYDELSGFLNNLSHNIDVLVLTETWFSVDTVSDVGGYDGFHSCRDGGRGGGVSIYVNKKLSAQTISSKTFVTDCLECCTVSISSILFPTLFIVGIYRPPGDQTEPFIDSLTTNFLSDSRNSHMILCGDFNVDLVGGGDLSGNFIETMNSFCFLPLITLPTRVTNVSATCIDHVWFNQFNATNCGIFETDITDHYTIFVGLNFSPKKGSLYVSFRDHSDQCLLAMKNDFDEAFVPYFSNMFAQSVDDKTDIFLDCLWSLYDRCCPIRNKNVSSKRLLKPWITNSLLRSINTKHNLFKQYKRGDICFNIYNNYKNFLSHTIRRSKRDYYQVRFEQSRGDIRKTWRDINSVLKCRKKTADIVLKDDHGVEHSDRREVADTFLSYFSSVAADLDREMPASEVTDAAAFMGPPVNESFFVLPSSPNEVFNLIRSLPNKNCNINNIPVFIYKHLASEISHIISDLFNLSIESGYFPISLKTATIIPIFKANDRYLAKNYRPISLIHILSKIYEKLMKTRMTSFIELHGLVSENQFGFRGGRSTVDAVLEFTNECVDAMDDGAHTVAVLLDLKKAFDTVNHAVLLMKMERMGFRGIFLDWIRSYLSDRRIVVNVGGALSREEIIPIGLPQGNVLSPLLFILYIDDMHRACGTAKCLHFADDSTMYLSGPDPAELSAEISGSLTVVSRWLIANRLTLNIEKTKYMLFSPLNIPTNLLNIAIDGTPIERVNKFSLLGILVDDRLRFDAHISNTCSKLSRSLGVIYKMSSFFPPTILKTLYFSIFYPHLIYGIIIWGGCGVVNVGRVERIQRRAMRLLAEFCGPYDCSTILPMKCVTQYFTAIKFHNCLFNSNHLYFTDRINLLLPIHQHVTRFVSRDLFNIPHYRKTRSQNFFIYQSINLWNSLPSDLKYLNKKAFKNRLKAHLAASYIDTL